MTCCDFYVPEQWPMLEWSFSWPRKASSFLIQRWKLVLALFKKYWIPYWVYLFSNQFISIAKIILSHSWNLRTRTQYIIAVEAHCWWCFVFLHILCCWKFSFLWRRNSCTSDLLSLARGGLFCYNLLRLRWQYRRNTINSFTVTLAVNKLELAELLHCSSR